MTVNYQSLPNFEVGLLEVDRGGTTTCQVMRLVNHLVTNSFSDRRLTIKNTIRFVYDAPAHPSKAVRDICFLSSARFNKTEVLRQI